MLSVRCNRHIRNWKKSSHQRISKIKAFINNCNWKGKNFPSGKNDWKKIEKNNQTIAANVLYTKNKKKFLPIPQNTIQSVKKVSS